MAIYHLTAKVISRGKGQSAIAAAAYRSGERLFDEQAEQQKYYPSREERIVFTDIMAPKDAPEWAHDRNQLWNQAERAEKRKDAQLAREIEVALPHELTDQQREWLIKDFAREQFVRRGYAVDIAIHAPDRTSDDRNHHAHLMISMRTIGKDGFAGKKDRDLNSSEQLGAWREQWAHLANRHLERHGHEARIDHRSLKEQGIDREPTMHVGYAANEMTARGAQSDRIDALREILARNEIRVDLKAIQAELSGLEKQVAEQGQTGQPGFSKASPDQTFSLNLSMVPYQTFPSLYPAVPSAQLPNEAGRSGADEPESEKHRQQGLLATPAGGMVAQQREAMQRFEKNSTAMEERRQAALRALDDAIEQQGKQDRTGQSEADRARQRDILGR